MRCATAICCTSMPCACNGEWTRQNIGLHRTNVERRGRLFRARSRRTTSSSNFDVRRSNSRNFRSCSCRVWAVWHHVTPMCVQLSTHRTRMYMEEYMETHVLYACVLVSPSHAHVMRPCMRHPDDCATGIPSLGSCMPRTLSPALRVARIKRRADPACRQHPPRADACVRTAPSSRLAHAASTAGLPGACTRGCCSRLLLRIVASTTSPIVSAVAAESVHPRWPWPVL